MVHSKHKGDRWENAVVKAMNRLGFPHAERSRAGFERDRGDIQEIPGLCVQAKDAVSKTWGPWLAGLAIQKANAKADHAVLVVKQVGKPDAADALAVMKFEDWLILARDAGYGQPLTMEEGTE